MKSFKHSSKEGFEAVSFPVGMLQCNCTIVWDPQSREAIVADPGGDFDKIAAHLKSHELKLKAIVHTHAHFDHIGASEELHLQTKAPLLLHEGDRMLWENVEMQGKAFGFPLKSIMDFTGSLEDEMTLSLGTQSLKTLHTPGHTPGSCSFVLGDLLIAGDTLFQGSIGRTDLWGGDFEKIRHSIRDRLYRLDGDTTVITGHGPTTTIGVERRQNAYVKA